MLSAARHRLGHDNGKHAAHGWTVHKHVIGCNLQQNANEGCNSCASLAGLVLSFIVSFIVCFTVVVIAPLAQAATNVEIAYSTSTDFPP